MFYSLLQWFLDWKRENLLGGAIRDKRWHEVRKQNIKDVCEYCGKKGALLNPLELHHVEPVNIAPEKELLPSNFFTACRTCHYLQCHLKSWLSYEINIRKIAEEYKERVKNRP